MASEGTSFSLLYGLSVLFYPPLSNRIRYMSCVYIHSMRTPPTEGNLLDNFNRKNLFAQVHNSTNFVSQTSFPQASEMTLNSTESLEITVLRSKLRASYTPTPTTTLTAMTAMLCWLALNKGKAAVHDFCWTTKSVRTREVLPRPWVDRSVCHLLLVCFLLNLRTPRSAVMLNRLHSACSWNKCRTVHGQQLQHVFCWAGA